MLKKIKNNLIYKIFFVISLYFSTIWINFYYISPKNVDFHKYYTYINYFLGGGNYIEYGQGVIYYFLISLVFKQYIKNVNSEELEIALSYSVQNLNLIFYIIGLIGLYKLMKLKNIQTKIIFAVLTIINFFPQVLIARALMKPEIIAIALLPWIIYILEIYYINQNFRYLFLILPFLILVLNSKATIAAMTLLYLLTFYAKEVNSNLGIKKLSFLILCTLISLFLIQIETYRVTNTNIYERPYDSVYDNKAPISILFKANLFSVFREPFLKYTDQNSFYSVHAKSVINLTLLDTFGDHFNQFFDSDLNYFYHNRKEFIQISDKNSYDSVTRTIYYNGPLKKYLAIRLDHLRKIFSVILSLIYYSILFLLLKTNKKMKKFYFSPFIGIAVLYLLSISGSYSPFKGDTIKSYYYSFLIVISLAFVLAKVFDKNRKLIFPIIIFFPLIVFFIGGHPKNNNQQLSEHIISSNSYSVFCKVNNKLLFENNFLNRIHNSGNTNNLTSTCGNRSLNFGTVSTKQNFDGKEIYCIENNKVVKEYSTYTVCRKVIISNINSGVIKNNIFIPFYSIFNLILIVLIIFIDLTKNLLKINFRN